METPPPEIDTTPTDLDGHQPEDQAPHFIEVEVDPGDATVDAS